MCVFSGQVDIYNNYIITIIKNEYWCECMNKIPTWPCEGNINTCEVYFVYA